MVKPYVIYERLLVTLLVIGIVITIGGAETINHRVMNDRDAVERAYEQAIMVLYKSLYDKLVTNPPGDEHEAQANFERGLTQARKARAIALESVKSSP
jgi:hypothetical protein